MPELPPSPIADGWFRYPVRVYPHHTDYGGIVWHGTYLTWMEAARVEFLRSVGIEFADLVAAGIDLPVVEMALRYHQAIKMGEEALVLTKLGKSERLRLLWDYQIRAGDRLCVSAQVSLVAVDRQKGKVMRALPSALEDAIARMQAGNG